MKKFVCAVLFFVNPLVLGSYPKPSLPTCRTLLEGLPVSFPNSALASLRNDELYLPEITPGSKIRGWVKEYLLTGKRLRPMAVYLSGLAMGIESSRVEKLAGIVELMHLGSLPMDDIIDGATERRGRPPLHLAEGLTAGIITGPYLQACVFESCDKYSNSAVRQAVARTQKAMGDAEIFQDELKERAMTGGSYSPDEYEQVAKGKTGYLFGLSLAISSLHFEMPSELVNDWLALGYDMGLAYQIKDDFKDAKKEPTEINFGLLLFSLRKGGSPFRQLTEDENAELLGWQSVEQAARRQKMVGILESIRRRVGPPQNDDQAAAFETLQEMIEYVTSP